MFIKIMTAVAVCDSCPATWMHDDHLDIVLDNRDQITVWLSGELKAHITSRDGYDVLRRVLAELLTIDSLQAGDLDGEP